MIKEMKSVLGITRDVFKHLTFYIREFNEQESLKENSTRRNPFNTPDAEDIRLYANGRKNLATTRGPR